MNNLENKQDLIDLKNSLNAYIAEFLIDEKLEIRFIEDGFGRPFFQIYPNSTLMRRITQDLYHANFLPKFDEILTLNIRNYEISYMKILITRAIDLISSAYEMVRIYR